MEPKKVSRKQLREDVRAVTSLIYAISDMAKVRGNVTRHKHKYVRIHLARCPEYAESMLGQEVAELMGCTVSLLNAMADKHLSAVKKDDSVTNFIVAVGEGCGISTQGE